MAHFAVFGNGPVEFVAQGHRYSIPLSAIYFDERGAINASNWSLYGSLGSGQSDLNGWLSYLVGRGVLTLAKRPAPLPALTIAAKDPGAFGNSIAVTFANVKPNTAAPEETTADVTINVTQIYTGLSLQNLASRIGTSQGGGDPPRLVHLSSTTGSSVTVQPATPFDTSGQVAFKDAFTLELGTGVPKNTKQPATVSVQDVDSGTFTLVTRWTDTKNIQLQDIQKTFGFFVDVAPASGGFKPPAEGTVVLSGGADAISAAKAQAIVIASS